MNRLTAPRMRWLALATTLVVLSGCATLAPDAGFGEVQSTAKERLNKELKWAKTEEDRKAIDERVASLLKKEVTVDEAVQIALLNNPGLQATYYELGIADANLVQAGRMKNPGFSFARLDRAGDIEYERKFLFDVLGLLTMPTRTEIERRRYENARLQVTSEVFRVAAETRKAYFSAIASEQGVRYMEEVKDAAEAASELASRMARAGNVSKLERTRNQAFYAEVVAQLAKARQVSLADRERLNRLLGVWGKDITYALPQRLPDLPKAPQDMKDAERVAMAERFDVRMAKQEAEGLAKSLGLTRATRFVNVLETSYLRNSATHEPRQTGYEIEISLPIFDFGDAKVAKAESIYMQAVNRVAEIAVNARSQVREAYSNYRTAYDVAKHYRDEVVPLRKQISEENLLRYNGMLIGVFDLLADARQQVASVNAYIEALRDYWIADADLQAAMVGAGSGAPSPGRSVAMPAGGNGGAGH